MTGVSRLLGRLEILDRLGESRFGSGGRVGVNHVLGGSLIKFLRGGLKCRGACLDVTRFDGRAHLANRCPDARLDGTIVETVSLILTEAFFGTSGIWHRDLLETGRSMLQSEP